MISKEQHRFNLEDVVERVIFSQIQNRKKKLYEGEINTMKIAAKTPTQLYLAINNTDHKHCLS